MARDFVEFPSQFNENWASYPAVFSHFAKHHQTAAPMPEALVAKVKKASKFNQGYALTEIVAAAELDMEWHTLPPDASVQRVDDFEVEALKRKHLFLNAVPTRYRTSYFAHIWQDDYAAGYYAYLWAEMLDHSAFQWFETHGVFNGQWETASGELLLLSRGNTGNSGTCIRRGRGKNQVSSRC